MSAGKLLFSIARAKPIRPVLVYIMRKYDTLAAETALFYLTSRLGGIGKNVKIGRGVHVEHPENVTIGDNVVLHHRVYIYAYSPVIIEDGVLIAEGVSLVTPAHDFKHTGDDCVAAINSKPITIKKDAVLNTRSMVVGGVTVGTGAVVSAHSLVLQDVEEYTYVIGVPARKYFKRKIEDRADATDSPALPPQ